MSERFYVDHPIAIGRLDLDGPEAHHLTRVSRLIAGDPCRLFNGDGHEYLARVQEVSRRVVVLDVLERHTPNRELPHSLEIAAPLPKGDRSHFLIEKLTELGVSTFVPLICQRGVVTPSEAKKEKLARYVIEASKQCGRNVLMNIEPALNSMDYWRSGKMGEFRGLAHPGDSENSEAWPEMADQKAFRLAVGPEGGFTVEEIKVARECGWFVLSLGPRILRVETAAIHLASLATIYSTSIR